MNLEKKFLKCHPRILCAKFGWNWPSGSLNFVNVFSLFCYHLPLVKGGTLHSNKLKSPSPKEALCQFFFKFCQCIFAISLLTSLRKGLDPLFEQTWVPFTKKYFLPNLIEIDTVVLKMNIVDVFSLFRYYLFLEMETGLHLK